MLLTPQEPQALTIPLWGVLAASYLMGALPFGFLFARLKGIDLRAVGSGNIGATNTMRALGRGWGLTAFFLDFAKGWFPLAFLATLVSAADLGDLDLRAVQVMCGTAAVLGHCFPVYLRFRGGKGVATGCGAIVGLDPMVFLGAGLVWVAVMLTLRFVGLASILMGAAFPILAWWRHPEDEATLIGASLLTLLIVVRHRANISRMLAGTEPRSRPLIGARRPTPPGDVTEGSDD
ncbi:MAG: glycerol-3-phosphate acyltransferase PlsY [Chlamydiales bacterium]|jgi:glycerol-3-phosphate acyltransferase PlsY